jgi:hypothetical protein
MNDEFDLEQAIAGEPLKTVGGESAEFIAYRPTATESSQVIAQVGTSVLAYYADGTLKGVSTNFDLRMNPKLKQIDWTKLPVDTLITLSLERATANRYFSSFNNGKVYYYRGGITSKTAEGSLDILTISPSNAQIAPDQPWTVWQGGDCPLPDGVEFEYMIHDCPGRVITCIESASSYMWQPKLIYAYRLTGRVLGGWTL